MAELECLQVGCSGTAVRGQCAGGRLMVHMGYGRGNLNRALLVGRLCDAGHYQTLGYMQVFGMNRIVVYR